MNKKYIIGPPKKSQTILGLNKKSKPKFQEYVQNHYCENSTHQELQNKPKTVLRRKLTSN